MENQTGKISPLVVAVIIVFGAVAFWAGMMYRGMLGVAPGAVAANSAFPTSLPSGQKPPDIAQGQVVSKQPSGFVVKARDGSTKTVIYASTTSATVTTVSTESAAKISVGQNVFVVGSAKSDGSVQAQAINIVPAPPPPPASGQ